MNGRIRGDETPEGRLAAVARSLLLHMQDEFRRTGQGPSEPDYADFRDAFRRRLRLELVNARISEARHIHAKVTTERVAELAKEKGQLESEIEKEEKKW